MMKKILTALFVVCMMSAAAPAASAPAPVAPVPGTVTLLNLRSDCIPCDLQDRVVNRIEKKYAGRVAVVVINAEKDKKAAAMYNVSTLPTLVFYDAAGNVAHRMDGGYMKQNTMDKILRGLLEE